MSYILILADVSSTVIMSANEKLVRHPATLDVQINLVHYPRIHVINSYPRRCVLYCDHVCE